MNARSVCIVLVLFTTGGVAYSQDIGSLKNQKPVTIHGSISAGLNYYNNFSDKNNSLPQSTFGHSPAYFIQANPVLSLYGFAIPVSAMVASQNKSFNTPFNRFGLSPYYKWAKLHLGWRSLNFSQFTLSGQQMLGAGFELTPGKFRAAFMYGKFNNAVTDISLYNNLNNNIPLYKRKGFAAKIGYGSDKNFIELSYLQAKDDSNSVAIPDTLWMKPAAANQVAGIKGQVTLLRSISIYTDAAASYYTRDLAGNALETDEQWSKLASFTPNTSSGVAFAGEAGIRYNFSKGNIRLKYRRVDPDYKSMGAFYMQTDIEQYTAGFNLSFLKNKMHLQSDIGWQKNNLAKTAVSRSSRTIGNVGINITPSQSFGIDMRYSNYGISQQIIPQLNNPATIVRYDSVRISQVNQSFSFAPHLFINKKNIQHSISLQASLQNLKNSNKAQSGQDFTSTMESLIYSVIFPEKKINITNTLNYFNTALTGNKTATLGYNLGASKSFTPDKMNAKPFITSVTLSLFGGYFSNRLNSSATGNTISVNPSLSILVLKKHSLQLNANYTTTKNKNTMLNPLFRQMMFSTRYNLSF